MSVDLSIPLNGVLAGERNLEQAAGRIAGAHLPESDAPADMLSLTDFAAELIAVDQAKTAIKANLEVISTHQEITRDILDIFA